MKKDEVPEGYKYQPEILSMLDMRGFYERYCRMISEYSTNEEAYEATERQFQSYFGKRRFKDNNSFKSALSRWLKDR